MQQYALKKLVFAPKTIRYKNCCQNVPFQSFVPTSSRIEELWSMVIFHAFLGASKQTHYKALPVVIWITKIAIVFFVPRKSNSEFLDFFTAGAIDKGC